MFAFQRWSSALEMKRYLCRYVHHIDGLPDFSALRFTKYNQYESMILPLVKYLESHGVRIEYGMDVKTLSAVVGHRSSSTTLNVYTHVTKAMERQAAAKIDQGIGKQEVPTEEAEEAKHPTMTTFRANPGKRRKPGTGCVHQIGDHLWEGRYSPRGLDGKQRSRNVYGHTLEECEEKLKALIETMKAEIQAERRHLREAGNRS